MPIASRATSIVIVLLVCALAACRGGAAKARPEQTVVRGRWTPYLHVAQVVDLTPPRSDGRVTVAANGRLFLLGPGAALVPFARGTNGYSTPTGPEPYIDLATSAPVRPGGCSFATDEVAALEPSKTPGVISVDRQGTARRVANLPGVQPNGIAFDDGGKFGHRLLVTASARGHTTVFGIDCLGQVTTITARAPTVEGGIAVAPSSFGKFAGDLIAPDEKTGRVWAIGPDGRVRLVIRSPLAHGGDIGVESIGFVPPAFTREWSAYVADRRSPGNPHPGTDNILRLSGADLVDAGVRPGELVIASEGAGESVVVACAATCTIRHIADGPPTAHIEGHVIFTALLR
jgi:hypothetical protein